MGKASCGEKFLNIIISGFSIFLGTIAVLMIVWIILGMQNSGLHYFLIFLIILTVVLIIISILGTIGLKHKPFNILVYIILLFIDNFIFLIIWMLIIFSPNTAKSLVKKVFFDNSDIMEYYTTKCSEAKKIFTFAYFAWLGVFIIDFIFSIFYRNLCKKNMMELVEEKSQSK